MSTEDLDRETWQQFGLCREMDPDMFFPERKDAAIAADAKRACGMCPVRQLCLDWAMRHPKQEGIAGGLDEFERADLRGEPLPTYGDDELDEYLALPVAAELAEVIDLTEYRRAPIAPIAA